MAFYVPTISKYAKYALIQTQKMSLMIFTYVIFGNHISHTEYKSVLLLMIVKKKTEEKEFFFCDAV